VYARIAHERARDATRAIRSIARARDRSREVRSRARRSTRRSIASIAAATRDDARRPIAASVFTPRASIARHGGRKEQAHVQGQEGREEESVRARRDARATRERRERTRATRSTRTRGRAGDDDGRARASRARASGRTRERRETVD